MPHTGSVVEQMMARFHKKKAYKKVKIKQLSAFRTGAKIHFSKRNILGLGAP